MQERYGFPIVNAANVYTVLGKLGISPWPHLEPVRSFEEFKSQNSKHPDLRFAPKSEVVTLAQPSGKPYCGIRSVGKNWATVFALLRGDLVPLVAEWKHGAELISLVPPSGVLSASDGGSMESCARREFTEETGFGLTRLKALSDKNGIPVSSRQSTQRFFPFLGYVDEQQIKPAQLDDTEHLRVVLMPLREWLTLIQSGRVYEDCAISITFLALMKLGRMDIR